MIPMGSAATVAETDLRWYATCFRMPFDAQGEPVWATDLVIADRVVAPILEVNKSDIALWRFHRRAAPDAAGHQFSFLVYVRSSAYDHLRQQIDASTPLQALVRAGHINTVVHDCRGAVAAQGIEGTSDTHWDPTLQRAWPYFIMGVSASWLALIQELANGIAASDADLPTAYAAVDARITALWGEQGQHAFLHHLSGIYGYQPLLIQKWLQF
jgi:hypothetical protein